MKWDRNFKVFSSLALITLISGCGGGERGTPLPNTPDTQSLTGTISGNPATISELSLLINGEDTTGLPSRITLSPTDNINCHIIYDAPAGSEVYVSLEVKPDTGGQLSLPLALSEGILAVDILNSLPGTISCRAQITFAGELLSETETTPIHGTSREGGIPENGPAKERLRR